MSNPRNYKSLDAVSATGAGGESRMNGQYHITVFVSAANLDTGAGDTFTVELEGSPDGTRWDAIEDDSGSVVSVAETDVDTDPDSGEDTWSVTVSGAYYEIMRLRVTGFTDAANGDLTIDGYIMGSGNDGTGARGKPHGP